jgi:hypothetical protein
VPYFIHNHLGGVRELVFKVAISDAFFMMLFKHI